MDSRPQGFHALPPCPLDLQTPEALPKEEEKLAHQPLMLNSSSPEGSSPLSMNNNLKKYFTLVDLPKLHQVLVEAHRLSSCDLWT